MHIVPSDILATALALRGSWKYSLCLLPFTVLKLSSMRCVLEHPSPVLRFDHHAWTSLEGICFLVGCGWL